MGTVSNQVTLIGAGQVGRTLAKALRQRGIPCRLLAYRQGLDSPLPKCQLVLICVRDGQILDVVERLRCAPVAAESCVAHVSGAVGLDILSPLKAHCRGIGQLHPFCSIRVGRRARDFGGVHFLAEGDRTTLSRLRKLVHQLGGTLVRGDGIDRALYHLSAALLANGSVALMYAASKLLTQAGLGAPVARAMLLGLQQSVVLNLYNLGPAQALTGPVRRGDLATIRRHLAELERIGPATRELYRCLVRTQIQIAGDLAELDSGTINRLRRLVAR